jgi:aminopeptidase
MDPRVTKLASVLINYSLAIQPGEQLDLFASYQSEELAIATYREALKAGAHVLFRTAFPDAREVFFKTASDEQLEFVPPYMKLIVETFDASLAIEGVANTRSLSGVDPSRIVRNRKAFAPLWQIEDQRVMRNEFRWCLTVFPTQAAAQEGDMSLTEFQDFVYAAGKLNEADPVSAWQAEAARQQVLVDWLAGRSQVKLQGRDIDLKLSIKDRKFIPCAGKVNFPDGEIFTGPVEDSVEGWVRFKYPAIFSGREVNDVELWFENGKVVRETATKNQDFLTATLNTDQGARYLGEWGIGTNYDIPKFCKNMLFDEKLGGTIHLAVGNSYLESGGQNQSGLHWDMLCDMSESEIHVDGDLFYKDGRPVV